ncbi:MAG TPA: tetratricopeptide repeat protein, partial [Sphingomicrobium sp.]|nr:tetratricopeptide repeat protein [Sphingomicrobium sp.]
MDDVGEAAARGSAPDQQTLARLEQLAGREPLSAQPFLVQGAIATREGDYERAERLLTIARQRAPRSPAARYLMGDLYLRANRPVDAMAEMAVLNRLLPAGSQQLAPSLAAYAKVPGSLPQIRAILASYPEIEEPLLATMSSDVTNTGAILQLASYSK